MVPLERRTAIGRVAFGVSLATTTAGCAFVLDFDRFEGCTACKDEVAVDAGEPDAAVRETPRCSERTGALAPFLTFAPLEASVVLQAEALTTSTRVYHSVYVSDTSNERDIVVRAFDITGEIVVASERAPSATRSLSEAFATLAPEYPRLVAPASMVALPNGNLALFTALAEEGAQTGSVVRIELDSSLNVVSEVNYLTEIPNFQIDDTAGRSGPAAGSLTNGEPFVVWQGCRPDPNEPNISLEADLCANVGVASGGGAIFGHRGTKPLDVQDLADQGVDESSFAGSLQALSGATAPAAVWATASVKEHLLHLRAGLTTTGVSTELHQCDTAPGVPKWLNTVRTAGAVSSVVWSKDPWTAEATLVQCTEEQCLDLAASQGTDDNPACAAKKFANRVYPEVGYVAQGVWANSNGDKDAFTIAAFVPEESQRLQVSTTQGIPDPNVSPLVVEETALELPSKSPSKVVLSLQQHAEGEERAVAVVGWVDRAQASRQAAHLSAIDLCLTP